VIVQKKWTKSYDWTNGRFTPGKRGRYHKWCEERNRFKRERGKKVVGDVATEREGDPRRIIRAKGAVNNPKGRGQGSKWWRPEIQRESMAEDFSTACG